MLTRIKKRSALLVGLAVICATVAIVPQTATAAASKVPNAGTATSLHTAPADIGAMTACPGTTAPAAGFTDTTSTDVDCIKMYGITQGTTATTYEPDGTIPRWQMALFIHRMFVPTGVAAAGLTAVPAFADIGGLSSEIQDAVNALASHGITTGTTATTFDPDSNVTREQMALFLNRFATIAKSVDGSGDLIAMPSSIGAAGAAAGEHQYGDIANTTMEGNEAIVRLFNLGVTEGLCVGGIIGVSTCGTTYRPAEDITRAEMASMVKRLMDKTNARPAGISIQAVQGVATAGGKTTIISARNADFTVQVNTLIDEFYDPTELTTTRALAASAPFSALGVCVGANVVAQVGTECVIDGLDRATEVSGNIAGYGMTTAASSSSTWYIWTGDMGTAYNSSAPGYILDVALPATATPSVYADTTTYTISGADALGHALTRNYTTYSDDSAASSNDGVLTYAGQSRTITATMKKSAAATSTVVDGYTFKFTETVISHDGTTSISSTYVPSSAGVASYTVTCGADNLATVNAAGNTAVGGVESYWESRHVKVTMGTAALGTGIPGTGGDPLATEVFPTDGGGDGSGGETLNISCDDEVRAYTAGTTDDTLELSKTHAVASTAGTLVGITTTAYDQYGDGIAGVTSKLGRSSDGGVVANQAVLTSSASGAATLNLVLCASGTQANGTEAFSQVNGGGSTMNAIGSSVVHGVGATDALKALHAGTTVYCTTAVTNATTVGGDSFGAVADVQQSTRIAIVSAADPPVVVDPTGGTITCTYDGGTTFFNLAHDADATAAQNAANATAGMDGVTAAVFASNTTAVHGIAAVASDVTGGGWYLLHPAGTGPWSITCGDTLNSQNDDLAGNAAAEAQVTVRRAGVAGVTWDFIEADIANNTMIAATVTKTTVAAGSTGNGPTVYRSMTWDSTDDIFMLAAPADPGSSEAAWETALAAIVNTTTDVSGIIRTVATGTGLSIFSLG